MGSGLLPGRFWRTGRGDRDESGRECRARQAQERLIVDDLVKLEQGCPRRNWRVLKPGDVDPGATTVVVPAGVNLARAGRLDCDVVRHEPGENSPRCVGVKKHSEGRQRVVAETVVGRGVVDDAVDVELLVALQAEAGERNTRGFDAVAAVDTLQTRGDEVRSRVRV